MKVPNILSVCYENQSACRNIVSLVKLGYFLVFGRPIYVISCSGVIECVCVSFLFLKQEIVLYTVRGSLEVLSQPHREGQDTSCS